MMHSLCELTDLRRDTRSFCLVVSAHLKLRFEIDQCPRASVDDDGRVLNARNQFFQQCSVLFAGFLTGDPP